MRDRRGLEEARNLTTVVFDKTGTLTRGEFRVIDIATDGSLSADDALRLAAAVERDSEHPVAQAIVKSAEEQKSERPDGRPVRGDPRTWREGRRRGHSVRHGRPGDAEAPRDHAAAAVRAAADRAAARGQASVYLLTSTSAVAAFAVADAVRPESREAVQRLHDQGIEVVMLTGDAKAVADAVAADLGSTPFSPRCCRATRWTRSRS